MRRLLVALAVLVGSASRADAQVAVHVGVGVALPGVEIGVHVPAYPRLVQVPGQPVYYAPSVGSNYFFYDGAYWVFQDDGWYVSDWYAGPWYAVAPDEVPLYVLRVPVRYYRAPPRYFRAWHADLAPRWGECWGHEWEHRHAGWDRWDRRAAPRPAPLPVYQRSYSGHRYPAREEQRVIRSARYGYEPRETVTRRSYEDRDGWRRDDRRGSHEHERDRGPRGLERREGRHDERGRRGGR